MGLGFLLPAFLAGMAALAIPVLLHLRQREREKPQAFPSLMFLSRIPIRTAQRRRITDWPLLLLRAIALALLVAAFARPLFRRAVGAGSSATRSVVVLMDRSLSMGHRESWQAAEDSALAVVAGLGSNDRVAVVAFDEEATVPQPFTLDHAAAAAVIRSLRPGARGTRYASAWRAARQLLDRDSTSRAELVLVSDLQKSGSAPGSAGALPPGAALRVVPVGPASPANTAVSAIDLERRPGAGRGEVVVAARIRSYALPAPRRVHITMTLGGRERGQREVTLPVDGSTRVAFDPVPLPEGNLPLTVSVDPDALSADDVMHAVVPADAAQRVILVLPPSAPPGETMFLERALAIGNDPQITIERRVTGVLDPATLRGVAAVIFYDVAPPGGSAGAALSAWVNAGGGVIVAAGERLAVRGFDGSFVPGRLRGLADRSAERGGTLGAVVEEHPVFSAFRGSGIAALSAAHFFRYPRVEAATGSQVLARFDDDLPALVERRDGLGRVLLAALPLNNEAGDFPRQAAFLPLVRRLVLHAAGSTSGSPWEITGEAWRPSVAIPDLVVAAPSGALERPDSAHGGALLLEESGIYSAYSVRASGVPAALVAANPPRAESDLTRLPREELLLGVSDADTSRASRHVATAEELEQRQQVWRWLLLVAALLLLIESWLVGRGWRARPGRTIIVPDGGVS
ncbi:MAG: BatA domain-containing protein [Gemmatimonadota bacterium]